MKVFSENNFKVVSAYMPRVSHQKCFGLWPLSTKLCRFIPDYPFWQHTFVSPSTFSRRAVVSYWQKYVNEVLVNRLGGLSLPRKSVVRLIDCPDMTLDVYPWT